MSRGTFGTPVEGAAYKVRKFPASGPSLRLDVSSFNWFDITMDQNCTIEFAGSRPMQIATSFVVVLRGAFTPTWTSVVWPSGSIPTHTTPSLWTFTRVDDGSWFGGQAGKAYA